MTELPPGRKRRSGAGPKPSLPGRRPLTVHLSADMAAQLWGAARRQGVGLGEMARRLIGKGLKGE
jgi:hypothetical protein